MSTESYGQKVVRLRKERGWTQKDLARESGVKYRTLQDVEAGRGTTGPQRTTRLRLNQTLGIAADDDEGTPLNESCVCSEWPDDVKTQAMIVAAHLMNLTPDARLRWMREVMTDIFGNDRG